MTKNQYFKELKKQLKLYAVKESEDILKDYEEHFNEALSNGKTEEEICKTLGSPGNIAKQYSKDDNIPKKKTHKKFLVLTIVFGIIMLFSGITTINLFFVNGPDSNIFWLKEETVYYESTERLEITLKNLSMKNYKDVKLQIVSKNKTSGGSHINEFFVVDINALSGLTTQVDLDKVYYEDCDIRITYTDKYGKNIILMQEKDYKPMKIMVILDSIIFVVGIAGFATFLPLYLVKRKQR